MTHMSSTLKMRIRQELLVEMRYLVRNSLLYLSFSDLMHPYVHICITSNKTYVDV